MVWFRNCWHDHVWSADAGNIIFPFPRTCLTCLTKPESTLRAGILHSSQWLCHASWLEQMHEVGEALPCSWRIEVPPAGSRGRIRLGVYVFRGCSSRVRVRLGSCCRCNNLLPGLVHNAPMGLDLHGPIGMMLGLTLTAFVSGMLHPCLSTVSVHMSPHCSQ